MATSDTHDRGQQPAGPRTEAGADGAGHGAGAVGPETRARGAPDRPAGDRPAGDRGAGDRGGRGGGAGGGRDGRGGGGGGGRDGRGGRGGRGGGGGGGRGRGRRDRAEGEEPESRLEERVIRINRVATTVKGGRRMSFSALVVVGDKAGQVGLGFGKAKEVPNAVEKAMKDARRRLEKVLLAGPTLPHESKVCYRSSTVLLLPAAPGTGVIAGAPARAVLECVGVQDVLTKNYGSTNPLNVAKATIEGLRALRTRDMVAKLRGVTLA